MSTISETAKDQTVAQDATNPGVMGEITGNTTAAIAEPQDAAAAVVAAAFKEAGVAGDSTTVEVVSQPKAIEVLIAERTAKRAQKKAAEHQLAEGHKRAGDVLLESKNYKAAIAQYQEALNLSRSNVNYYISLATAYRKLMWYEEAAHSATEALILDPKNTEARYIRGVARLEQRLLGPAKIDFEIVLQHDPSHFLARAALTEVTAFIGASTHPGDHALAPNPIDEVTKDVDFGFPPLDYESLEIASVSDSSDCNHVGNGVPCRFYNHDGCARGTLCMFSHAPDEKSVRDELGRNVCIYHLLDSCKFGPGRCVYSHSKLALPKRGWWTSPEKIAKVKAVMEVTERKAKEARQTEAEQWKAYIKSVKANRQPRTRKSRENIGKDGQHVNANANANVHAHGNGTGNANGHGNVNTNGHAHHSHPSTKAPTHHTGSAAQHSVVKPKKTGQGKKARIQGDVVGNGAVQKEESVPVGNGPVLNEELVAGSAVVVVALEKENVKEQEKEGKKEQQVELVAATASSVKDYLDAYYAIKPSTAAEYLAAYYKVVA